MRRLAVRLVRDEHVADDVVQQAWLSALKSPPMRSDSVRGWLATVVRNAARKSVRSDTRRRSHEHRVELPGHAMPADDVVVRAETQQRLGRAVLALDEPYRKTVLLRFYDDLPPREVARRMGVPVETVRTRARRALELLRGHLDRESGGDGHSWALALIPLIRAPEVGTSPRPVSWSAATGAAIMASVATKNAVGLAAAVLLALAASWHALELAADDDVRVSVSAPAPASAVPPGSHEAAAPRARSGPRRGVASPPRASDTPAADSNPDAPAGEQLRVRVYAEDDRPLPGVTIIAYDESLLAVSDRTGRDGWTSFSPAAESRRVVVAAPGIPLHAAELRPGAGEQTIRVPSGVSVSGVVRVNGVAPSEPLDLRLLLPERPAWADAIPERVWWSIARTRHGRGSVGARFVPRDRFAFDGLPRAAALPLTLPEDYVLAGTYATQIVVAAPDDEVVLDLIRLPRVTGRVVLPDGRALFEPRLSLEWDGASGDGMMVGFGEEDGTFEVVLPCDSFTRLDFSISDAEGQVVRNIELLDGAPLERDLGTVQLADAPALRLLVRDADGASLTDAKASFADHAHISREAQADADGLIRVPLNVLPRSVRVGAPGHEIRALTVESEPSDPMVVTLLRTATLAIEVSAPKADPAETWRIQVVAAERLFSGNEERYDEVCQELYEEACKLRDPSYEPESSVAGPGTEEWFGAASGKPVQIGGIIAGVPFEVRLVDALGVVLSTHDQRLDVDDPRTLRLSVDSPGRTLSGTVRKENGEPLVGKQTRILVGNRDASVDGRRSHTVWVDDEGRFRIPGVRTDRISVLVLVEGFVPWIRTGVRMDADDTTLPVVLDQGRTVRVRLLDDTGRPLERAYLRVQVPGLSVWDEGVDLWTEARIQ